MPKKPFYEKLLFAYMNYKYRGQPAGYEQLNHRYRIDLEDKGFVERLNQKYLCGITGLELP